MAPPSLPELLPEMVLDVMPIAAVPFASAKMPPPDAVAELPLTQLLEIVVVPFA